MELESGAESDRHSVVDIAKAIGRVVRLLIIGEGGGTIAKARETTTDREA